MPAGVYVFALSACLVPALAQAQAASCIQAAADRQAFEDCAQTEILPLEAEVVSTLNALRSRYRDRGPVLQELERAHDGWNVYRNYHCQIEAAGSGGRSETE